MRMGSWDDDAGQCWEHRHRREWRLLVIGWLLDLRELRQTLPVSCNFLRQPARLSKAAYRWLLRFPLARCCKEHHSPRVLGPQSDPQRRRHPYYHTSPYHGTVTGGLRVSLDEIAYCIEGTQYLRSVKVS